MKNAKKWLVPLIILVVVAGLIYWSYSKGPVTDETTTTTTEEGTTNGTVEVAPAPAVTTGMVEVVAAE